MNEIKNETDMLKGNTNRMTITDDEDELYHMYQVAKTRLDKIFQLNVLRLERIKAQP